MEYLDLMAISGYCVYFKGSENTFFHPDFKVTTALQFWVQMMEL